MLPLMEEFYTIQGEGFHTGTAAYFRTGAGCFWPSMAAPIYVQGRSSTIVCRLQHDVEEGHAAFHNSWARVQGNMAHQQLQLHMRQPLASHTGGSPFVWSFIPQNRGICQGWLQHYIPFSNFQSQSGVRFQVRSSCYCTKGHGFHTALQLCNEGGSDSFAFVIHNAGLDARGRPGGGLGYAGMQGTLAVEFDIANSDLNPFLDDYEDDDE